MSKNYSKRNLTGRSFRNQDLRAANFRGANVTDVDWTGADVRGADFTASYVTRDCSRPPRGAIGEPALRTISATDLDDVFGVGA